VTAHCRLFLLLLLASCASTGQPQEVHLAPNAPADRPVSIRGDDPDEALAKWRALVAPHSQKAKATYPQAKSRYLAGLPPRETFFVTTVLRDRQGRFEYVFIVVQRIAEENVTGRIATQVNLVRGYRGGDTVSFPEADVVDWMISKPDGSEEGNLVGKFLDTQSQEQ
jgi:uncharacterized protein YegJ (DUF2314 family)